MFGQDFADLFAFHNISFVPWGQPITFHTFVKLASKAIVRRERPNQHIATQVGATSAALALASSVQPLSPIQHLTQ